MPAGNLNNAEACTAVNSAKPPWVLGETPWRRRQWLYWPVVQYLQLPQWEKHSTATGSPIAKPVTPSPSSATTPQVS